MNKPIYELHNTDNLYFYFTSTGVNGDIIKIIKFEQVDESAYNLCLGDKVGDTDEVDDSNISNNGDMVKIFSTVIKAIEIFFQEYPDKSLVIEGNTTLKNKLYKRIIKNNFHVIEKEYHIFGAKNDKWVKFNHTFDYDCFVIHKK